MVGGSSPSPVFVFAFCAACIFGQLLHLAHAQNETTAVTDPAEARTLNSIFQGWGILAPSGQWNISGEPCSGAAIGSATIDNTNYNPFIKCVCTYDNNTICHITELKVYGLNVVGVIPKELWTLNFLTNLNLGQNYLTGNLSTSISNLTRMQYLALCINALSGELPKELGNLTDLKVLSFSSNNFSGSLPSELGNLVNLEQIYFDSSGVSGEIPSTFADLQNLQIMWASDTELTGRIPDFIGNWSKLSDLRLQGNSFQGPIPSSFSNLTSLTQLRIGDLSNGSSSLAFIKNMKSLSFLELRNNNISDSIPSNIGDYQKLTQLDLSFNNITGQIPDSLFNLSSLSYLFLGNNKLNGTLPAQKSASLLTIDLSYNNLVGSFPSWISETNLQLNVVSNNFTIESSNSSALPSGLNCLQRGFPCYRGSYLNILIFLLSQILNFVVKSIPLITRLERISRLCRMIIIIHLDRHYDGLKKTENTQQSIFKKKSVLTNLVTVLYINQEVTLDMMDIGVICVFVQRRLRTCCLWPCFCIDFTPTGDNKLPSSKKNNRTGLIIGVVIGAGVLSFLSVFVVFYIVRRRKQLPTSDDAELLGIDVKTFTFSYAELKTATEEFSPANKLGEGGFGPVFKGTLHDGRVIAVKQLSVASHQGKNQFITEIATISAVQHRNLVKLYGCCIEGDQRLLVYEFLENRSLDQAPNADSSLEEEKVYLLEWAWHLHENNCEVNVIDSTLSKFNEEEVKRMIGVSLLCTQASPTLRPSMSRVVAMLSGDIEVSSVTSRPGYLTDWKFDDETSLLSDVATKGTHAGIFNSSSSTSIMGNAEN
ncbi:hypothetical protein FH972_025355 [Carpinus fangiana]|uniref:Protein kinase domain-containing protein n=1 Tax=Carpinus fangiana TaxID=176857 RepID=A0A5N6L164_9ROSI|nr:hypothetical protein FH972_025355 [Carpinus fangiana]